MDEATTIAALEQRVAELEALVARLTDERAMIAEEPEQAVPAPPDEPVVASAEPTTIDRRRLLTRGGTAAAGAVLGGVAATIATAAPAAAATGSFDSNDSGTALTVTNTGTGSAFEATGAGPKPVATFTATTGIVGVDVEAPEVSTGLLVVGKYRGLIGRATSHVAGFGVSGEAEGFGGAGVGGQGTNGSPGVWGHSPDGIGVQASGESAQFIFYNNPTPSMPPPITRSDAHLKGELYFADDGGLWLCLADGSPGTWTRLGGTGTAGAFTVLATPTRVYDTRANSGLPGAGTGPVSGVRHDIDLSGAVPVDATAALVTLTVTDTVANPNAYGQIYANGLVTPPSTSSINWTAADSLVATTTTTALTAGKVAISMNPGANVLIDVLGYYR